MELILALRDYGPHGGGESVPHKMLGADGVEYIVKFPIAKWPRALVNEVVAGRLAQELQIPIPGFSLIEVRAELVDSSPALQARGVAPGIYFGSKFSHIAVELTGAENVTALEPRIENPDDAYAIVMYDQWCLNGDRHPGNLLLIPSHHEGQNVSFRMVIIDNGLSLTGGAWTAERLKQFTPQKVPLTRIAPLLEELILNPAGFHPVVADIASFTKAELAAITMEVPTEWPFTVDERSVVTDFLDTRRTVVQDLAGKPGELQAVFPYVGWFPA